ncbi:extracellular solute-binding protein [uncultured Sphaerochaeta sp.]|uniref:ABC transporter substrate-binding protein n=1 Tax=uncultured Sphaerochaeta sp. TaxID=886478 RepID=UPI002A0A9FD8|nr:extracellular solute-binding protein [uncultured Sphaerochaeta sp.]
MKRFMAILSCLLLLTGVGFANGSQEKNSDSKTSEKKDNVFWLYETTTPEHEQHLRKDLIDVVNSRAKDYEVTIRFDANYDQNLRTAMLSGTGPDLVQTAGPSYVQEFANEGYLYPLDDFAKSYGWDKTLFPMMLQLGTIDGHLYALPKTYETMVLFYNKTMFEKYGWEIPKTWADYEKLCSEIKAKGITPIVSGNANWRPTNEHYVTIFFNHIAGPENIRKALEGKLPWTSPCFVNATETLKRFFSEYFTPDYFSYSDEDSLSVLASGEAAMYPSGTWNFQRIDNFFKETGEEWDWAPLPSAADVPYPLYELGIGATLSINAKSKRPDAVAQLLNTLFSDKQVIVNLNADWPGEWNLPINTLNRKDFGDRIDPRYARCIDEIGDAVNAGQYGYTTWTFWPEKTDQLLWNSIEKVFLGTMSVQDYLQGLDSAFQADLKAGTVPKLPD